MNMRNGFMMLLCWWPIGLPAATLQEIYDDALADSGYDKMISLRPQEVYTGSLLIDGRHVRLHGHGALINGSIKLLNGSSVLDVDHCVFIRSDTALNYNNGARGQVTNCTFYRNAVGIRMFSASSLDSCKIQNCIFTGNSKFAVVTYLFNPNISFCCNWDNGGNFYSYCACPINPYTQFSPMPGTGMLYADPLFSDTTHNDFRLSAGSPCVHAGIPPGTNLGAGETAK